jgi:hypothetical protein
LEELVPAPTTTKTIVFDSLSCSFNARNYILEVCVNVTGQAKHVCEKLQGRLAVLRSPEAIAALDSLPTRSLVPKEYTLNNIVITQLLHKNAGT